MSEQTPAPPVTTEKSGCLRTFLIGTLIIVGLIIAFGVGITATSLYSLNKGVVEPIGSLVKKISLDVTPEVRPDPVTVIRNINDLAQLQTASYTVEKIVTADGGSDGFLGIFEDTLIFVAVGEVTAGIDLAKLTENDIRAGSFESVAIRLPEPEIFIATLDNENSYVADRDTGLLTNADPQLETLARQAAEEEILNGALEQGILDIADENAKSVLEGFLKSLGFQEVVFVDGELPPPVEYDPEIPKGFIVTPDAP